MTCCSCSCAQPTMHDVHLTPQFDRLYVIFIVWLLLLLLLLVFAIALEIFARTLAHINKRHVWHIVLHLRCCRIDGVWHEIMWECVEHIFIIIMCVCVCFALPIHSFEWFNYGKHSHLHQISSRFVLGCAITIDKRSSFNVPSSSSSSAHSIDMFEIEDRKARWCVPGACTNYQCKTQLSHPDDF